MLCVDLTSFTLLRSSLKIVIYIALWKRKEVTEMCFKALEALKQREDFEIEVFCVVSESGSVDLCKEYGYAWVWAENSPLSNKLNTGLQALKNKKFDYLLQLGSDDLISDSILDFYKGEFEAGTEYFGLKEYFMIEPSTKRAKWWEYDINHPIGAGRCFKRDLLEKMNWTLWSEGKEKGLDTDSDINIIKSATRCKILNGNKYPYVIDVKTTENIHNFSKLIGLKVNYDFVTTYIPKECEASLALLET